MMGFRFGIFVLVLAYTAAVWALGWRWIRGPKPRLFFTFGVVGLYWYSGVGTAYETVGVGYIVSYMVFVLLMALGFIAGLRLAGPGSRKLWRRTRAHIDRVVAKRSFVIAAIAVFYVGGLLPLLYPEFKLGRLIAPGPPDILAQWAKRSFSGEMPAASRAIEYIQSLSYPFYLMALYAYRRRPIALLTLMAVTWYLRYCAMEGASRGGILLTLALWAMVLWIYNPRARRRLVVGALALVPVLAVFFQTYRYTRHGVEAPTMGGLEAARLLAYAETSFPVASTRIIHSSARADLADYATWLLTLPIPKIFTGAIDVAMVNYDISEVALGRRMGTKGSYVILFGLVAESVYIYGASLFWVHALMIGLAFGALCSVLGRFEGLTVMFLTTALFFGYILARAGVAAALPRIVNQYMALYLWLAFLYLGPVRRRHLTRVASAARARWHGQACR